MPQCETCGNDYERAIEIRRGDRIHWFDCFECAIHALAPRCAHCRCTIIGHGIEHGGRDYCCTHCARRGQPDLPLLNP